MNPINFQNAMSMILQQNPAQGQMGSALAHAHSLTPNTPNTAVFSPAMAEAQLVANNAFAVAGVTTEIKKVDRLEKNRRAARQCRLKKKEYQKCLEERVALLEARQEELLKELMMVTPEMSAADLQALQLRIQDKYRHPVAGGNVLMAPPDTPGAFASSPVTQQLATSPITAQLMPHAIAVAEAQKLV
jgi:hypothetical protein